ncbi:hypothetical protein [Nitrosophilus alvini]|uniref:hypothetical protein n=1 Tax=Nitrosophilus alvini TaxID=2714855 RepID=UPI00190DF013|nr:hypothetical protein [Nitrosophilus alvini]
MDRNEALELLEDKKLPLEKVKEIFENFGEDMEVVGMVAMNLSLRTSVYDREKEKSPIMTELLVKLSQSEDMGSRWAVAKNPHTPSEVLEKLSRDEVNLVRALVATNPNTPKNILSQLFSDEKIVRDGLSGNPNTPLKLLNILADDRDKMVRLRVAENPSSTENILKKLAADSDIDVSKAANMRLKKDKR